MRKGESEKEGNDCVGHEDEDKVTKQEQGREYQRQGRYVKGMKGDGKVELRTVIKKHLAQIMSYIKV